MQCVVEGENLKRNSEFENKIFEYLDSGTILARIQGKNVI